MGCEKTKKLAELFAELDVPCSDEVMALEVSGVTDDSREVKPGMLFVAVAGLTVDGHHFIGAAVTNGCAAVLVSRDVGEAYPVPVIKVADTMEILGFVAAAFYDYPCRQMKMIGVTGTNGKTTCTYLLEAVVRQVDGTPGIIGTVAVRYKGQERAAAMTTPRAVELQQILREMADAGVTHVAMEVSSHALAQKRVNGVWFDVGLFTNLSRDHLDFHACMESYFAQKEILFAAHLKKEGKGVIVLDSPGEGAERNRWWSDRILHLLSGNNRFFLTCGINRGLVQARGFSCDLQGMRAEIVTTGERYDLQSPLVGKFNLKNMLGVIGCGQALGIDLETICLGLARLTGIPGRLERITVNGEDGINGKEQQATVFVDYAHTPDALENVLKTLRNLEPVRLIVVFGCGGDRDQGKRFVMGEIAGQLADVVLLTSDNPRTESPQKILEEIECGVKEVAKPRVKADQLMGSPDLSGYDIIEDRAEAIRLAIGGATGGDVVLISGKGHEDYQIVGDKKLFFDDRHQAKEQLNLARQAA